MSTTNSPSPGFFTEALGQAAYAFSEVQPYLPMYLHLILSALFPIFTGAHASLVRPSSAFKPKKKLKKEGDDDDDDDDDDEEDDGLQKMEGLSNSDAIVFPLLAGSTLAGLYFLIKWAGAELINKILGGYFSIMAVFSVAKLSNDGFAVLESFCWPEYYVDGGVIWQVKGSERKAVQVNSEPNREACSRSSPLPGVLGRINLPPGLSSLLWFLRGLPSTRYIVRAHVSKVVSFKVTLTLRTILSTVLGFAAILVSNFVSKAWWLTNLQGFAFSYNALQLMSPTTFGTGSLILAALFFYDIYFVFYTPMMVTVATKLDVPIKLLFPRPIEEGQTVRKLAMLGLGDIVLPGIMIGLALRFDLWVHYLNKQTKTTSSNEPNDDASKSSLTKPKDSIHKERYQPVTGHWGNSFWTSSWTGRSRLLAVKPLPTRSPPAASRRAMIPTFRKPYFRAAVAGYVAGMCATLGIMQVFNHAQPALLYLVPGVLISLWGTGFVRGELKQMLEFTEAEEEEVEGQDAKNSADKKKKKSETESKDAKHEAKKSWWGTSFFSSAKAERNAKRIEDSLAKHIKDDGITNGEASLGAEHSDDNERKGNGTSKDKDNQKNKDKDMPKDKDKDKKNNKKKTTTPPPKEFLLFSITLAPPRGSKSAKAKQESDKTSAVDTTAREADNVPDQAPRWRGAKVGDEARDERAGKRLRTR